MPSLVDCSTEEKIHMISKINFQPKGLLRKTASTLSRQLSLYVHSADGALLIGEEPLVHTQLMEEVHTG